MHRLSELSGRLAHDTTTCFHDQRGKIALLIPKADAGQTRSHVGRDLARHSHALEARIQRYQTATSQLQEAEVSCSGLERYDPQIRNGPILLFISQSIVLPAISGKTE
jgi:hypothetical protein